MEAYIRNKLSPELLLKCYGCLDNVAIVTLAPELEGAHQSIEWLTNNRVVVSLGEEAMCVLMCTSIENFL